MNKSLIATMFNWSYRPLAHNGYSVAPVFCISCLSLCWLCFSKPAVLFEGINHIHGDEEHERNRDPEAVFVV